VGINYILEKLCARRAGVRFVGVGIGHAAEALSRNSRVLEMRGVSRRAVGNTVVVSPDQPMVIKYDVRYHCLPYTMAVSLHALSKNLAH
jgi:hypothetical protein